MYGDDVCVCVRIYMVIDSFCVYIFFFNIINSGTLELDAKIDWLKNQGFCKNRI